MLIAHLCFETEAAGETKVRLTDRAFRFDVHENGRVVCDVPRGYPAQFEIRGSGGRWTIADETFDGVFVNGPMDPAENPEQRAFSSYERGMDAYHGISGPRDFGVAFGFFSEAAEANHESSNFRLGELLLHGRGCERDVAEAERRFTKAAIEGHPDAQLTLALAYRSGRFLKRDFVRAHAFYTMCDQPFRPEPRFAISNLIGTLTPEQFEESARLVSALEAQKKPLVPCGPGESDGHADEQDPSANSADFLKLPQHSCLARLGAQP
jgi:TPR repeat protein